MSAPELDLREAVRRAYSAAASDPGGDHPFAVGRELALGVGYPADVLDRMPEAAVAAFAGVDAISLDADLAPGHRVLDVGCGAGLDSLIADERGGRVVGIDFSAEMLGRARDAVGARSVGLCRASAEALPLAAASVDVALANGIFNLNPAREAIFAELARVVAPGGRVVAAELVLREALPESERTEASWFA